MKTTKIAVAAAIAVVLTTAASAEEKQTEAKVYECGGEKMTLTEEEGDRLALQGKGLTGYVSIHRPTGMYRGSVDGWGSQHKTPEEALDAACRWLLKKAQTLSEETLQKRLHEFFENVE